MEKHNTNRINLHIYIFQNLPKLSKFAQVEFFFPKFVILLEICKMNCARKFPEGQLARSSFLPLYDRCTVVIIYHVCFKKILSREVIKFYR